MIVQDLHSTEVHSCTPESSVRDALRLMGEHRIRHVPVVVDGRVAGVVSDRDLLAKAGEAASGFGNTPLSSILRAPALTITPEDTVTAAAMEMMSEKVGALPVVDGDKRLVGMLTETDLIRAYADSAGASDPEGKNEPRVSANMSRDPLTLGLRDDLGRALEEARHHGYRHFPILDSDGELAGIVSDRDICREVGAGAENAMSLEAVMTRSVETVEPEDSLLAAARKLLELRISCLPVVEGEKLVGVITSTDLIDHCLISLGQA